ncbi:hypothetical protein [Pseudoclavibacter sp. CFCC 11306]|uniref:hypothetical protein n=1 Tax=Pseudoclavibacter sp. CFCC 11306 TaxID=1564493 RepID=UPI0013018FD5|nr:hypothetical protein [Pseudoclavibacter sp. CFCC 11306]KAB1658550.1 hypothetical protein F8O09_02790 [Pseudoclavibacter sp. CFCC 11306]
MAEEHQLTRRELRARERAAQLAASEAAAAKTPSDASKTSGDAEKKQTAAGSGQGAASKAQQSAQSTAADGQSKRAHHRHGAPAAAAQSTPAQRPASAQRPAPAKKPAPQPAPATSAGSAFVKSTSPAQAKPTPKPAEKQPAAERPAAKSVGGPSSTPGGSQATPAAKPAAASPTPSTAEPRRRRPLLADAPVASSKPRAAAPTPSASKPAAQPSQPAKAESTPVIITPATSDSDVDARIAPNKPTITTGPATASVLVLPSTPEQNSLALPLDSTGDVLITTGSITLPQLTTDTGVIPAAYEKDRGDPLADTSDSVPVTDETRPVSAVETVRRYETDRILPENSQHDRMNKLSIGLLIGAGVLLIAATVFVLLRIFGA